MPRAGKRLACTKAFQCQLPADHSGKCLLRGRPATAAILAEVCIKSDPVLTKWVWLAIGPQPNDIIVVGDDACVIVRKIIIFEQYVSVYIEQPSNEIAQDWIKLGFA